MILVFKKTNECVSSYNRSTKGLKYIQAVDSLYEMYAVVANLEDMNFFPQEDDFVLDGNGNEVFDPKYKDSFDFGDYIYTTYESTDLDIDNHSHVITAIKNKAPFNEADIMADISG